MSNAPVAPDDPEPRRTATSEAAPASRADSETARAPAGATASETPAPEAATTAAHTHRSGKVRLLGVLVIVAGIIMAVAGVITWIVVRGQLSDENITVSDDADMFAGQEVDGPFTAYAQANVINKHALEATDGQTYAELPQDSELRQTAMTASFLRASLYTSVVAFGVAVMAFGLGIVLVLIGWALMSLGKTPKAVPAAG